MLDAKGTNEATQPKNEQLVKQVLCKYRQIWDNLIRNASLNIAMMKIDISILRNIASLKAIRKHPSCNFKIAKLIVVQHL